MAVGALKRRRLGKTGLQVSELGLGAMDTPQSEAGEETLHRALDLGVDFVDTAREYEGSEFLIGQVVRARKSKDFVVATKTFSRTRDGAQREVDRSLNMLGVDKIDIYQLHDVSTEEVWDQVMGEAGALEGLQIAQYRGLIGHIGVSSHSLDVLGKAIASGEFDTVMLEYSAFFCESNQLIVQAKERDIGVIVMRPFGGSGRTSTMRGRIEAGYVGALTPSMLLRYVLSNPDVSVAIPGARLPVRIDENVTVASNDATLTEAEKQDLEAEARLLY